MYEVTRLWEQARADMAVDPSMGGPKGIVGFCQLTALVVALSGAFGLKQPALRHYAAKLEAGAAVEEELSGAAAREVRRLWFLARALEILKIGPPASLPELKRLLPRLVRANNRFWRITNREGFSGRAHRAADIYFELAARLVSLAPASAAAARLIEDYAHCVIQIGDVQEQCALAIGDARSVLMGRVALAVDSPQIGVSADARSTQAPAALPLAAAVADVMAERPGMKVPQPKDVVLSIEGGEATPALAGLHSSPRVDRPRSRRSPAEALVDVATPSPSKGKGGRLAKHESEAKRVSMLALLRAHPTMKGDLQGLANQVGVSVKTVSRWMAAEEAKYRESLRRPDTDEERP
ncbi:MAG TPA: hypothetical protein VF796_28240 [Humisphaera sp.]